MKIPVRYDGSKVPFSAMNLATRHAKAFGGEVHIVTSLVKGRDRQQDEISESKKKLENAKETFYKEAIKCDTHLLIRELSTREDLVEFAMEKNVDEIIIGVKRRSKVSKLIMGSTAQYVILNSPCPVVSIC
jgi:nucleotide-binding universal stress UspA family protein